MTCTLHQNIKLKISSWNLCVTKNNCEFKMFDKNKTTVISKCLTKMFYIFAKATFLFEDSKSHNWWWCILRKVYILAIDDTMIISSYKWLSIQQSCDFFFFRQRQDLTVWQDTDKIYLCNKINVVCVTGSALNQGHKSIASVYWLLGTL